MDSEKLVGLLWEIRYTAVAILCLLLLVYLMYDMWDALSKSLFPLWLSAAVFTGIIVYLVLSYFRHKEQAMKDARRMASDRAHEDRLRSKHEQEIKEYYASKKK
ncbi:hypothetical protein KY359_01435 [Candidatus Woesearchaeota archaeon]|nr:hypothetical protein [Candidatus Woesearchaeota archaeon]